MRGSLFFMILASWLLLPLASGEQPAESRQSESDEQKLKAAGIKTDGPALLAYLRSRTLSEEDREHVDLLIAQLGASSFKAREQATNELVAKGPSVLAALRQGLTFADLEVQRRCENCIQKIKERDRSPDVTGAVVRLLAARKPAGAIEVLIAHLPCVDNEIVVDDIRDVLASLAADGGKVSKALVRALNDKVAVRRATAGEALVRAGALAQHKTAIHALLRDSSAMVRCRVGCALVVARDKSAIETLIDVLPEASEPEAWEIEETLCRLAAGKSPPAVPLGEGDAERVKCRAAWQKWWKENGAAVDLAVLDTKQELGWTTMVLLDAGRIFEVDRNNNIRWQIDDLLWPLDLQVLDKGRVLVAEYHGKRVTERNFKGQILWQIEFNEPQMAQRLANGNTFIANKYELAEYDRYSKRVFHHSFDPLHGPGIMKCMKLPNGEISCFFDDGRVMRLDAKGNVLSSFRVEIGSQLYGGRIHALPNGNVLIPLHFMNWVKEFDSTGKELSKIRVDEPVAAVRLSNGNTLVTSMKHKCALEFDSNSVQVWKYQYPQDSRLTRAIRR
jgi:hypothetical protein